MYLICLTCFPDHSEFISKYKFRQKNILKETETDVYRNILDFVIRCNLKTEKIHKNN